MEIRERMAALVTGLTVGLSMLTAGWQPGTGELARARVVPPKSRRSATVAGWNADRPGVGTMVRRPSGLWMALIASVVVLAGCGGGGGTTPPGDVALDLDLEHLELEPGEAGTVRVRIRNLDEPATLKIEGERVVLMTAPGERALPPREIDKPWLAEHPDKIIILIDPANPALGARGIEKKDIRRGFVIAPVPKPVASRESSTPAPEPLELVVTIGVGNDVPEGEYVVQFSLSPDGEVITSDSAKPKYPNGTVIIRSIKKNRRTMPEVTPTRAPAASAEAPTVAPSAATPMPTITRPTATPTPTPGRQVGGAVTPVLAGVCPPNPSPAPATIAVVNQPAPNALVTSPVTVTGLVAAFEATFLADIVDAQQNQLAFVVGMAQDGTSLSPFTVQLPFSVTAPTPACVRIYQQSAADGSYYRFVQVPVVLMP